MKTMKLTSAKSKSEKYDAGRVIEKKAGRKAEMMTIKNEIKKTKDDRVDTTDLGVDCFNQSAYFPYFAYGEVSDLGYN